MVVIQDKLEAILLTSGQLFFRMTDYFKSISIKDDTYMSLSIGFSIGILVLTFVSFFPGEPFDYTPETER
jgi:hypothetical protein